MAPTPGSLLRSKDDLIGTGFPDGNNIIMGDRICLFLRVIPFNGTHDHYQVLVLDYYGTPIVDDVIATKTEFNKWFDVVYSSP